MILRFLEVERVCVMCTQQNKDVDGVLDTAVCLMFVTSLTLHIPPHHTKKT